jgi:hypothetical protein
MQLQGTFPRPFPGASSGRPSPGLTLLLSLTLTLVTACAKTEKPPEHDRDTASEEMLSGGDRAKLAQIAVYSPEAIVLVKELVASPDMFVRMMTLTRLQRWPRDRAITFVLGAAGHDVSSLVRAKALKLAWQGVTELDREDERFAELVDVTFARLSDPADEVFGIALNQLMTIDDTGHLAKLVQLIPQAVAERRPRLFRLFCRKDLSREDVQFILGHDRSLGLAAEPCREQVSRAHRQKYLYE